MATYYGRKAFLNSVKKVEPISQDPIKDEPKQEAKEGESNATKEVI
jgi:hypothetical protein